MHMVEWTSVGARKINRNQYCLLLNKKQSLYTKYSFVVYVCACLSIIQSSKPIYTHLPLNFDFLRRAFMCLFYSSRVALVTTEPAQTSLLTMLLQERTTKEPVPSADSVSSKSSVYYKMVVARSITNLRRSFYTSKNNFEALLLHCSGPESQMMPSVHDDECPAAATDAGAHGARQAGIASSTGACSFD